jgi:transposase
VCGYGAGMAGSRVKRAFKYRFYPTSTQAEELRRTFGCVRLVYNRALEARSAAWSGEQRRVSYAQTSAMLTEWKRDLDLAFLGGRELVVTERWFPSSKVCSACGVLQDTMPLGIRKWTCRCGAFHDRDVNAARSILAAGLAVTACGDRVRPARAWARGGGRL